MWSFYNSIRWCIYVTFPTKLISTKLWKAVTKHERVTFFCETPNWSWNIWNCYMYISSNLSTAIPIPVWSSLRSRKLSQWLKINWYWPLLLLLHQAQHCTCNTFCEKPNVTRASMSLVNKSYYKIMAICGQSLLNAYQWTYYIIIIFYSKLINSVKLGLKTCIKWYICKMSQNFPKKAINL